MEDTHSGATGLGAAGHAEEEFSIDIVGATILGLKTQDDTAADTQ